MRDINQYPFEIRPLDAEEGGGYLISFPDFSECISDGEIPEEAIRNGLDALAETIAALEEMDLPIPTPGSGGRYSGRFVVLSFSPVEQPSILCYSDVCPILYRFIQVE